MMINHDNSRFDFYFQYNWNLYIICKFLLIENSPLLYPRLSKEIDRIKKISSLCIILIKQSGNIRKTERNRRAGPNEGRTAPKK